MNIRTTETGYYDRVGEFKSQISSMCVWCVIMMLSLSNPGESMAQEMFATEAEIESSVREFVSGLNDEHRARFMQGVRQVASLWQEADGNLEEMARFCEENYITDPVIRQQTADRFEVAMESIWGHLTELGRELGWHLTIETGPLLPIDYFFARLSLGAHVSDDMFKTKTAFVALLNFPLHNLSQRLEYGPGWSREEWAQSRLVDGFSSRVPPEISQGINDVYVAGDTYISEYNIFMHHLIAADGTRFFPEGMRLVTHWNLRDELKSQYAEADGLKRQEMIYEVMQAIVRQSIPAAIINNPGVDWHMETNEVTVTPVVDGDIPKHGRHDGSPGDAVDNSPEPDTRYAHLLAMFKAQQAADRYYPTMPTLMDRRFQRNREIPEEEVEALLRSVLGSELIPRIGKLIEQRLGRKLRPFDIWYDGFKARAAINEDELDSIVRQKYPTVDAFQADLPAILVKLGFDNETAAYLGTKIQIDPSRGIGHAAGPGRRSDKARLRTRVGADGMNYKGYNIAIHEFGHNVEQVLSLNRVDHTLLSGVPNTAFTEGFAFVFQSRDLELLSIDNQDPAAEHLRALDEVWGVYEIGGVALVDMAVWNWMYANPDATPAELKEAVLSIARDVWNEFFAPVFGETDIDLLAIYSHMIDAALYLPDYPMGSIIAFQIEEYFKGRNLGDEMERMCSFGSITPDLWMQNAVGTPISAAPLLEATGKALEVLAD